MNQEINIEKNIVRYIIPFSFQLNKKITFSTICQRITERKENEKEPLWVEYCISNKECDLYDAIQKSMQYTTATNQGIGQYYRINTNCIQKHFPKLRVAMENGNSTELNIVDMGLHIFQAGIGFFWYELNIKTNDINDLLLINNSLKEITHSNSKIKVFASEVINKKLPFSSEAIMKDIPQDEDRNLFIKISGKNAGYIRQSTAENDLLNKEDLSLYLREGELWCKYKEESEFDFALFIVEHLLPFDNVKYFASRKRTYKENSISVPDKAILFSIVIENGMETKDIQPYLYWLGKGYVDSYFVPDSYSNNLENSTYEPFQNSIWFTCMEGCAQIISKSDNNKRATFYETTYITRLEDYFYVYILVLHQYYGLLKYDEDISLLPNDIVSYNKAPVRKMLYNYKQRLNFFMMNSVFLKVSHITHHNMFFEYVKQAYGIEETTTLMMEKISLMNDMVEQWQEKKRSNKSLGFTIIGGIFVVVQTFNNILGIYDFFQLNQWIGQGIFSVLSLLASVMLGFIIWICVKDWRVD